MVGEREHGESRGRNDARVILTRRVSGEESEIEESSGLSSLA